MSDSSDPDLIKITEIFLIPSSFIVAALGTADTNPHRVGVSVIGLMVGVLWWISSHEALAERTRSHPDDASTGHSRRIRIMYWMPVFFAACWAVSVVVHIMLWRQPLGQD